jgi:hypothetical protein
LARHDRQAATGIGYAGRLVAISLVAIIKASNSGKTIVIARGDAGEKASSGVES